MKRLQIDSTQNARRQRPSAIQGPGDAIGTDVVCDLECARDGLAITRDAIALDVFEMRASGAEITTGDRCVARLDDDAAAAGGDQTGGGAHTRPHATLHGARLDVAFRPRCRKTGAAGLTEDLLFQAGLPRPASVTDASRSGCEVVVYHGGYLNAVCTLAR